MGEGSFGLGSPSPPPLAGPRRGVCVEGKGENPVYNRRSVFEFSLLSSVWGSKARWKSAGAHSRLSIT